MDHLLAAAAAQFLALCIGAKWKQLRDANVDSSATMAISGVTAPFFFLLAVISYEGHGIENISSYVGILFLWIVAGIVLNLLNVYLLRYQGLAEHQTLRVMLSLVVAFVFETIWFGTPFSVMIAVGFVAVLVGSSILRALRKKQKYAHGSAVMLPWQKTFGFAFVVSLTAVGTVACYKQGLSYSPNAIFHLALSQALLFSVLLLVGFQKLCHGLRHGKITRSDVLYIAVLMTGFVACEMYAISGLPLSVFILMEVVCINVATMIDSQREELRVSQLLHIALVLITAGLAMIGLGRLPH